jgi:hypothetical protein
MRQRFIGGALLAAIAVLSGADTGRAQVPALSSGPPSPVFEYPISLQAPGPDDAGFSPPPVFRGQAPANIGFDPPINADPAIPIPTGAAGSAGFYATAEYVMLTQTRALGEQTVAFRGFIDSRGNITGLPGTYVGSGVEALNTRQLGRTTFQPGVQVELGYRFEDGTRIFANYMQLFDAHYAQGATLVPPFFRSSVDAADTFLVAGVYNFPPEYAGPQVKLSQDVVGSITIFQPVQAGTINTANALGGTTSIPNIIQQPQRVPANSVILLNPVQIGTVVVTDNLGNVVSVQPNIVNVPVVSPARPGDPGFNPGFNAYGIWNGASVMDIKLTQRYTQAEIGARVPMFQTDYSRVYGIAGGRFAWFFERFWWRTVSFDIDGVAGSKDQAFYTNTLSQRLYGPFVGCGHEIFVGNQFSVSTDLTAAALIGIVKERATYELGDRTTRSKRSHNEYTVVPNANASVNLWWYPIEGVQVRVGYTAMTYFNTRRMEDPIGFNFGSIDPNYDTQVFRLLHGFNVGFGLFF